MALITLLHRAGQWVYHTAPKCAIDVFTAVGRDVVAVETAACSAVPPILVVCGVSNRVALRACVVATLTEGQWEAEQEEEEEEEDEHCMEEGGRRWWQRHLLLCLCLEWRFTLTDIHRDLSTPRHAYVAAHAQTQELTASI